MRFCTLSARAHHVGHVACPPGHVTGLDLMCRPGPLAQGPGAGPWPGGAERVRGLPIFNMFVSEDYFDSSAEI